MVTYTIGTHSGVHKYRDLELEFADGHREPVKFNACLQLHESWLKTVGATRLWGTRVDTGEKIRLLPVIEISLSFNFDYDHECDMDDYDLDDYDLDD